MDKEKRKKLEDAGWKIGSTQEFLDLTDDELRYIDSKLSLSRLLKKTRKQKGITQEDLGLKLDTTQSRVALMEQGDSSVTIDKILRALYVLNVPQSQINSAFEKANSAEPA